MLGALTEQSTVTIVVALLALCGVFVTAAGAVVAARYSRSTNREVKYRNGGGVDGTLAERLDARFERIEHRFDRLEEKHLELDARVDKNTQRINRNARDVRDMRRQALAFFDRFYLKERDDEMRRVEQRGDGDSQAGKELGSSRD